MELKGASLRRGYELLKGQKQKKNRLAKESNIVPKGKGNGVGSCTEEVGGVVRMKIVVRKSELKQLVEVMNGGVKSTMFVSSGEQRLNLLWKKKYLSRAKGNHRKCWSPVLQSIPEEKLV